MKEAHSRMPDGKPGKKSPPHRAASGRILRSMTQPEAMKTSNYVCGVERLNGNDAWAMFKACAARDVAQVRKLLAKDSRLVNSQFWYQFPIHFAVRSGDAELVRLLLERGADPGQSTYTFDSWPKLLKTAHIRSNPAGMIDRSSGMSKFFKVIGSLTSFTRL